ncbi:hypothetical protein CsSME_00008039 [Camellia sinensis var. sinensis]
MIFCLRNEIQYELDSLLPLSWSQLLEKLALPNIKWICPTAPTCPVAILGGFPRTAWFDVRELSEDSSNDFEGLDASIAHIANLLSTEAADIKLGIGGFSMGVATALYSATCFAQGKYGNGIDYPINLRAIVGLSGWLPGSREVCDANAFKIATSLIMTGIELRGPLFCHMHILLKTLERDVGRSSGPCEHSFSDFNKNWVFFHI